MAIETVVARGAQLLIALSGAYLVVLWFVTIVWTFRDIESRSRSVVTQVFATLLSVLFPFLGIPLYLILRPKDTLDGAFQRSLEEEYLLQDLEELPLCPSCQRFVEDDFQLCPHCHTQLRDACPSCSRLVDLRWAICPYCAAPQDGYAVGDERVPAPAARWVSPASRRRRTGDDAAADGAAVDAPARPIEVGDRPAVAALSVLPGTRSAAQRSARPIAERRGSDNAPEGVMPRSVPTNGANGHDPADAGDGVELFVPRRGRFQRPAFARSGNGAHAVADTGEGAAAAGPRDTAAVRVEGD
ncbi:MAG: hypothetical protein AVDCRST_MAG49-3950 [uncultured Thermomicrobiales bacterium]|uniref:DZANK-type domain-containing protein n=1 Tax=uncultured Thermomicrobiales bacterium TaxID=1645740 RepID=A0A6J4VFB8_9BACT|nr:MAG: hypothetical protein AVDCRST_MAG49-3950 [uncultured Thermomicrobiales bacterium]